MVDHGAILVDRLGSAEPTEEDGPVVPGQEVFRAVPEDAIEPGYRPFEVAGPAAGDRLGIAEVGIGRVALEGLVDQVLVLGVGLDLPAEHPVVDRLEAELLGLGRAEEPGQEGESVAVGMAEIGAGEAVVDEGAIAIRLGEVGVDRQRLVACLARLRRPVGPEQGRRQVGLERGIPRAPRDRGAEVLGRRGVDRDPRRRHGRAIAGPDQVGPRGDGSLVVAQGVAGVERLDRDP